jgi:DNA-binding NtrC family response regulator
MCRSEALVVALIDGDLAVRRALSRALVACGADVRVFANAEDALAGLHPGEVDLIVTDFDLPGLDGAELITAARARGHQCSAVVVSGEISEHHAARLQGVDDLDLLSKPFELPAMVQIMARCKRR